MRGLDNLIGYLYRVGRTAARRDRAGAVRASDRGLHIDDPSVSPELVCFGVAGVLGILSIGVILIVTSAACFIAASRTGDATATIVPDR